MIYDAKSDPQHTPTVFVNPGEGPIAVGDIILAIVAAERLLIDAFSADAALWSVARAPHLDEAGRFGLELRGGAIDRVIYVGIPGLPVDDIRFMGLGGQNPWDYPRLYVYDAGHDLKVGQFNSWLWMYAITELREREGLE